MIRPLGYGQEANYWEAIPATSNGVFDARFYGSTNKGKTWDEFSEQPQNNYKPDYYVGENVSIVNVSPFLTGRNYRGVDDDGVPIWQDDFYSDVNDPDNDIGFFGSEDFEFGDNQLTGMFYVNNPSNRSDETGSGPFPKHHEKREGFNDLERRKKDLCRLANACCLSPMDCEQLLTFRIIKESLFAPLPMHGH